MQCLRLWDGTIRGLVHWLDRWMTPYHAVCCTVAAHMSPKHVPLDVGFVYCIYITVTYLDE